MLLHEYEKTLFINSNLQCFPYYYVVLKIFRFVPIPCPHLPSILSTCYSLRFLITLLLNEARAFYSHFTREKIHLPRQNLSEFSLFLTTQNAERSKPSQICSYHAPFWTTNKSTRSGAIPSISKAVVVVVAMVVLLLYSYKRRILIISDLCILIWQTFMFISWR